MCSTTLTCHACAHFSTVPFRCAFNPERPEQAESGQAEPEPEPEPELAPASASENPAPEQRQPKQEKQAPPEKGAKTRPPTLSECPDRYTILTARTEELCARCVEEEGEDEERRRVEALAKFEREVRREGERRVGEWVREWEERRRVRRGKGSGRRKVVCGGIGGGGGENGSVGALGDVGVVDGVVDEVAVGAIEVIGVIELGGVVLKSGDIERNVEGVEMALPVRSELYAEQVLGAAAARKVAEQQGPQEGEEEKSVEQQQQPETAEPTKVEWKFKNW